MKDASDDKPRTIHGVVEGGRWDSILLVGGERATFMSDEVPPRNGLDAQRRNVQRAKGMASTWDGKGPGDNSLRPGGDRLLQPSKPKRSKATRANQQRSKPAGDPDRRDEKRWTGSARSCRNPQGLNEQNAWAFADIDGNRTRQPPRRDRLPTGGETPGRVHRSDDVLKGPGPEIGRIAAFAIEGVVKAYPNGMSSEDMQKVDSDGHRKMVKRSSPDRELPK